MGCKDCGTDQVISELLGRCHRCQRLWREGMVRRSTGQPSDTPPPRNNDIKDPEWNEWERTRSQRHPGASSPSRQQSTNPKGGDSWSDLWSTIKDLVSNIKIWWRDLDTESSAPRSDAVRHATELYLLWLDEGDGDMPVDPKVRKHYTELAQKHPACSVEEEARAWLHLQVVSMSDAEIRQAVEDAASRMPKTLTWAMYEDKWAAAHKDNISDLIAHKNASN